MLERGQALQKAVENIRRGNPNEMASWDLETPEKAWGSFDSVANLLRQQLDDFKPKAINEQEQEGDDHLDIHDEDVDTIENRISSLEERLNGLEEDYVRKIGYGDHHEQLHKL